MAIEHLADSMQETFITLLILGLIVFFIYTKSKRQTMKETWMEIKDLFISEKEGK